MWIFIDIKVYPKNLKDVIGLTKPKVLFWKERYTSSECKAQNTLHSLDLWDVVVKDDE